MKTSEQTANNFTVKERSAVLFISMLILYLFGGLLTGQWVPSSGNEGLWFVSSVGFLCFNLLSAPFFVKPSDSLASGVASLLLLWSLDLKNVTNLGVELNFFRWLSFAVVVITVLIAGIAIVFQKVDTVTNPKLGFIAKLSYHLSINLGKGAVIFTPPVSISIFGYYQDKPIQMLGLGFIWIILVTIQPVEFSWRIIKLIKEVRGSKVEDTKIVGQIQRIDSPNILRVTLSSPNSWSTDSVQLACLPDSRQVLVLPLFSQVRDEDLIGTGLCVEQECENFELENLQPGYVYCSSKVPERSVLLKKITGLDIDAELVGFVVENSTISTLRFEISTKKPLQEGNIVFCIQGDKTVYYQILDAQTTEESFESNPRGTHVVTAAQLGVLDPSKGFVKYSWLPHMNSPVFLPMEEVSAEKESDLDNEIELGNIPGSKITVRANFSNLLEYHTAILGVTGTGKTEMVSTSLGTV